MVPPTRNQLPNVENHHRKPAPADRTGLFPAPFRTRVPRPDEDLGGGATDSKLGKQLPAAY